MIGFEGKESLQLVLLLDALLLGSFISVLTGPAVGPDMLVSGEGSSPAEVGSISVALLIVSMNLAVFIYITMNCAELPFKHPSADKLASRWWKWAKWGITLSFLLFFIGVVFGLILVGRVTSIVFEGGSDANGTQERKLETYVTSTLLISFEVSSALLFFAGIAYYCHSRKMVASLSI